MKDCSLFLPPPSTWMPEFLPASSRREATEVRAELTLDPKSEKGAMTPSKTWPRPSSSRAPRRSSSWRWSGDRRNSRFQCSKPTCRPVSEHHDFGQHCGSCSASSAWPMSGSGRWATAVPGTTPRDAPLLDAPRTAQSSKRRSPSRTRDRNGLGGWTSSSRTPRRSRGEGPSCWPTRASMTSRRRCRPRRRSGWTSTSRRSSSRSEGASS